MNPFDKNKKEAEYMAYEHGANSSSKEENPYQDMQDDPKAAALSSIWIQGFNSVKRKTKKVKEQTLDLEPIIEANTNPNKVEPWGRLPNIGDYVDFDKQRQEALELLDDKDLLAELKKRKQLELQNLLADHEHITNRINRLKALMEL